MNKFDSNGIRHGYWGTWGGNVYLCGFYNHGKRKGYWEVYENNGTLMAQKYYL